MNVTKRILITEDQETERIALREILRSESGWEITETKDGQEALDLLCDGLRPDVCLIDLRMPKVDGLQMLQRMRRDPLLRDIKVIITDGKELRVAGVDELIPFAYVSGFVKGAYPHLLSKDANKDN